MSTVDSPAGSVPNSELVLVRTGGLEDRRNFHARRIVESLVETEMQTSTDTPATTRRGRL